MDFKLTLFCFTAFASLACTAQGTTEMQCRALRQAGESALREAAVQDPTSTQVSEDEISVSWLQLDKVLQRAGRDHGVEQSCLVGPWGTSCPKPAWVDEMIRADPTPGKTIVNVGCNKGNDAIRWMELWDMSPNSFWSQSKWNSQLKAVGFNMQQFACAPDSDYATAATIKPRASKTAVPTGVCVEPMPNNIKLLQNVSRELGFTVNSPHGSFHIVQAAVVANASANETMPFPNYGVGQETAHLNDIDPDHALIQVPVPVKTLDSIMEELGIEGTDILSIDTEGYDAEVLKGSKLALSKVRYLEFEVHRDLSPWSSTSLKSVVDDLDGKGFDCYWAGNNGKLAHIKKCWDDNFEVGVWANAACVKRGDIWSGVMQQFAM